MKSKILLVISILFGLMFINSGLNKFFNYLPIPSDLPSNMMNLMFALMQVGWLFPLVAIVEIVGGALFMIPRTRALGAIVIFPVMVGILLIHILNAPSGLPLALVLVAINLWVIIENWRKYLPMVNWFLPLIFGIQSNIFCIILSIFRVYKKKGCPIEQPFFIFAYCIF